MRFVVTADWHLRDIKDERYEIARWILSMARSQRRGVIIAGDILDKGVYGFSILGELVKSFEDVEIYAIRGNHDKKLSSGYFASENFKLIDVPQVVELGGILFAFIPYMEGVSDAGMTPYIEGIFDELKGKRWVLVSHGDWLRGNFLSREDAYFPLFVEDIRKFSPDAVFLGHIHKMYSDEKYRVFYPGSPVPVDSGEYGERFFIEFDTDTLDVAYIVINSAPVYVHMTVWVKPIETFRDIDRAIESEFKRWRGYNVRAVDVDLKGITVESKKKIEDYLAGRLKEAGIPLRRIKNDVMFLADVPDVIVEMVERLVEMAEEDKNIDKDRVVEVAWNVVSGISF